MAACQFMGMQPGVFGRHGLAASAWAVAGDRRTLLRVAGGALGCATLAVALRMACARCQFVHFLSKMCRAANDVDGVGVLLRRIARPIAHGFNKATFDQLIFWLRGVLKYRTVWYYCGDTQSGFQIN